MKDILFFYGLDCPHCVEVEKHVDKLIEEGVPIKKLEVWNNMENDKIMESLDVGDDMCGGVPFFLNKNTGKTICGEATYKEIKNWAEGK
ncbi:MAG: hypothetical protein JJE53_01430 [Candidatus Pacebacteria bacterium]|nr:hypothetical protein [Candidatus Paceibacterota bacterium]